MRSRRVHCLAILLTLVGAGGAAYYFVLRDRASNSLRAAQEAIARHAYREAVPHVEAYLKLRPSDWRAWLLATGTARRMGDFQHAIRFAGEAEKHAAPAAELALERRLIAVHAGNIQRIDDLLDFCQGNPHKAKSMRILEAIAEGSLRAQDVSRLRQAAKLWLEQSAAEADQVLGLLWLGQADKLANEGGSALNHFQRAVERSPENIRARILLVATLVHDRPAEARPHLDFLRQRRPDDLEVVFQTARMYRYLGQAEKAAGLLDDVLARAPDSAPALLERGRVAMDMMDARQAEPWLRKAVALAPRNRMANIALGECLRRLGRPGEAQTFLDRAAEIARKSTKTAG